MIFYDGLHNMVFYQSTHFNEKQIFQYQIIESVENHLLFQ